MTSFKKEISDNTDETTMPPWPSRFKALRPSTREHAAALPNIRQRFP